MGGRHRPVRGPHPPAAGRHIFGIGLTGTSVNPARSIAPAIFAAATGNFAPFASLWIFIVGPLVGAFLAELLLAGKDAGPSLKASLGAFLGFLSGTGMKLVVSAAMLYYIIVYI